MAGAVVAMVALLPYLNAMLGSTLTARPLPLPLPVLAVIQSTINFSIATGLGLLAAGRLGLGAPVLEAWLYGEAPPQRPPFFLASVIAGAILGIVAVLVIVSPLGSGLRHLAPVPENALPLWKRLLACLYGGLGEEVLMRLFLLSVVLWVLVKIFRAANEQLLFWVANALVALVFGAGHLPFAATLTTLTPALITAIISINALVALGFGYLYWKRGLEAAIIAHFTADIILHVIGPAFVKG